MIRLSETDRLFFLQEMPFFFDGKTHYGAKNATVAMVESAMKTSQGDRDLYWVDAAYRTIWGEAVLHEPQLCRVVFWDSAEMFAGMRSRYLYEEEIVKCAMMSVYTVEALLRKRLPFVRCEQIFDRLIRDVKTEAILPAVTEWKNASRDRSLVECDTVDRMTIRDMNLQIRKTSSAFATDMIVLKFIQGLPIIGVAGGIGNPVYYQKVLNYVQLMYKKRYLIDRMAITQSI